MTNVLAVDLGATSGRVTLGKYENGNISLEEINRFNDYVIHEDDGMYWDINKIMDYIIDAMIQANENGGFESVAVDTWGVDFGILDKEGKLLRNPVHYRDPRTEGMLEKAKEYMDLEDLYNETGIQIMEINTLFQLLHLKENESDLYDKTEKILMMPDLINYLLTGKMFAEKTIASTTQLFDPKSMDWNEKVISKFQLKRSLFFDTISAGSKIGKLKKSLNKKLEIDDINVVSIASHDTASAVLSVPSKVKNFTFLSSGTWSLLGQELAEPIINKETKSNNLANEVGAGDTITFLNNITGLWILEETIRAYKTQGSVYTYNQITDLVENIEEIDCFIDVEDERFGRTGNMPKIIKDYAIETNQMIPEEPGQIFKVIYQSLALKYKQKEMTISKVSGFINDELYIVGGGSNSKILCQMTANALNKKVIAGPSEATAIGNIAMQLVATEKIESIDTIRNMLLKTDEIKVYLPEENNMWEKYYKKLY